MGNVQSDLNDAYLQKLRAFSSLTNYHHCAILCLHTFSCLTGMEILKHFYRVSFTGSSSFHVWGHYSHHYEQRILSYSSFINHCHCSFMFCKPFPVWVHTAAHLSYCMFWLDHRHWGSLVPVCACVYIYCDVVISLYIFNITRVLHHKVLNISIGKSKERKHIFYVDYSVFFIHVEVLTGAEYPIIGQYVSR